MMEKQHTIERPASVSGIALHTGARATLRILPAETDRGIIFRRMDLPGTPEVRALATNVVDARRGTTIACGNAVVYTVEHIMSALHVAGIDNAVVEMDGLEPPIADGSAMPYWEMVKAAGRVEQAAPAEFFHCREILHLKHGDTQMVMMPAEQLEISCLASFRGCPFDPQYQSFVISPETYEKEIAGARTFVEYKDLEQLLAMGLVKGGSLDAAAIIHNGAIICKERLLFQDEIVRHKILDVIGDMYLCGRRVKANIIAIKPGHSKNVELAGMMIRQMSAQ